MSDYFKNVQPHYRTPKQMKWLLAIYNASDTIVGYSMPQINEAVDQVMRTTLSGSSEQAVWEYWEQLWRHGKIYEEKTMATVFWTRRKNYEMACRFHKQLLGWASDLDNWGHSDALSSLYSQYLESMGKPIDQLLHDWNSSENPWLRRQSVVSLLYYTRIRKKKPTASRVLGAIEPLLHDEHYYVQKGVGWTLREVYQVDEARTMKFIEKHLHVISPAAYSASVEKVPAQQKKRLRELRAARRKA